MAGYYDTQQQALQRLMMMQMGQRRLQESMLNNRYNQALRAAQLRRQYEAMRLSEHDRAIRDMHFQQNQQRLYQALGEGSRQRDEANKARLLGLEMQLRRLEQPRYGNVEELQDPAGNTRQVIRDQKTGNLIDARTREPVQPTDAASLRKPIPLRGKDRENLEKSGKMLSDYVSLLKSFKPEYAGNILPVVGELENVARQYIPGLSSDQPNWWREFHRLSRMPERHGLAGSALTSREIAEYSKGDINPGMKPDDIVKLMNQRIALTHRGLARGMRGLSNRFSPQEIMEAAGIQMPEDPLKNPQFPTVEDLAAQGARISGVGKPPLDQLLNSDQQ